MRDQFGDDLTVLAPLDAYWVEAEVRAASTEQLANELAGWGNDLEVIAPDAVRQRLARLGAELVERYEDGPHDT